MSNWSGTSKGNHFGYLIFIQAMRFFGLRSAYFILFFVALYYVLFSNTNKFILDYFRNTLKYSIFKSYISLYKNYYILGQTIIDKFAAMSGLGSKFLINYSGIEYLKEIDKNGTGAILLSAHIGNYEIASHHLKELKTPVNIIMYDGEQKAIKETLDNSGFKRSSNIIYIKEDLSHIFEIANKLLNKEIIIMHADRFQKDMKTFDTMVMGRMASLPLGPFQIISKFKNVPIAFVFGFKQGTFNYDLYTTSPFFSADLTLTEIVEKYTKAIEIKIEKYPLQWFNYFYFWKLNSKV